MSWGSLRGFIPLQEGRSQFLTPPRPQFHVAQLAGGEGCFKGRCSSWGGTGGRYPKNKWNKYNGLGLLFLSLFCFVFSNLSKQVLRDNMGSVTLPQRAEALGRDR